MIARDKKGIFRFHRWTVPNVKVTPNSQNIECNNDVFYVKIFLVFIEGAFIEGILFEKSQTL